MSSKASSAIIARRMNLSPCDYFNALSSRPWALTGVPRMKKVMRALEHRLTEVWRPQRLSNSGNVPFAVKDEVVCARNDQRIPANGLAGMAQITPVSRLGYLGHAVAGAALSMGRPQRVPASNR